jgi:2-oxo-4-hydroxy-4-carboxy-5-ureidoimidazoline decarboxylase
MVHFLSLLCFFTIPGKEGILRLHPDLAGRLAASGNLTAESTKEQSSAGLQNLTEQERQKMNHLNQQYKQKFGFPFVICAREKLCYSRFDK